MPGLLSFGLNILADVFYPKYCFGCQKPGGYLCKFCITQIPGTALCFCVVCNKPSPNGFTHVTCATPLTPDRLLSAFVYQNKIVADMIITGKYYFVPEVFAVLGALAVDQLFFSQSYEELAKLSDFVICAVPLHSRRLRWRGFNQSEVAGKIIAQGLKLPFFPILKRIKNTQTQKDLNAEGRKTNLQNAFTTNPKFTVIPKKVLLIDDVSTTGQTFLEAARALKQAGVKTVWCISIAKD
ncbi:MAG TPA: phosphoribosyltransferase family protein [Patescibacteria group bacterium]|jgi:ComF family protein|nr:phosphoribosyltransferase family protein [Patescibacteria group bacterium]